MITNIYITYPVAGSWKLWTWSSKSVINIIQNPRCPTQLQFEIAWRNWSLIYSQCHLMTDYCIQTLISQLWKDSCEQWCGMASPISMASYGSGMASKTRYKEQLYLITILVNQRIWIVLSSATLDWTRMNNHPSVKCNNDLCMKSSSQFTRLSLSTMWEWCLQGIPSSQANN